MASQPAKHLNEESGQRASDEDVAPGCAPHAAHHVLAVGASSTRLAAELVIVFTMLGRSALAEPRTFAIDPAASQVVVRVGKTGLLRFAGHEHEVILPVRKGTVVIDPLQIDRSSVNLEFDATGASVTGRGEPAQDVPKVQAAMVGPECLDTGRFPTIRFVSESVSAKSGSAADQGVTIRGTLTMHGVSRETTVTAHVALEPRTVTASGTFELKQSDYGIKPVTVAGVVKVDDRLTVAWRLVGRAARP
jgi:polyisoprenoid-binding protein YceI